VFAGAGAAGHRRATKRAAAQRHINFHRGVTARIEDFARLDICNFAHNLYIKFSNFKIRSGYDKSCAQRVKKALVEILRRKFVRQRIRG
jgi:hypothetical protein